MEDIQKRLALKIKLNKIENCGIAAPILLNELLAKKGYTTKVVQGFASLGPETIWHVWVECEGKQLDIAQVISKLYDPNHNSDGITLSETYEDGSPKENQQVTAQWELYQQDSKQFWRETPMKVQNFRASLLRSCGGK